jgi:hypothetical protein
MQKKGWSGGVAHVVECLPSKCEALSSIKLLCWKKKKKREGKKMKRKIGVIFSIYTSI